MDIVSRKKRSLIMSQVKDRGTKPEILVRAMMDHLGVKYQVNVSEFPGKPDIVLARRRKVIFVHGCFWHQHRNCPAASRPTTRKEFWNDKLNANIKRDRSNLKRLKKMGFESLVIWECELKKSTLVENQIRRFLVARLITKQK